MCASTLSHPLFRQRLRGTHLRNRLVLSRPTRRRRIVDFGRRLACARSWAGWRSAAGCCQADAKGAHPFHVVAALEAGIALFGLAIPLALPYIQQAYLTIAEPGAGSVTLRAIVCFLILTPPTMLMGATLPAIARWLGHDDRGASVGLDVYGEPRRRRHRHRARRLLPAARA